MQPTLLHALNKDIPGLLSERLLDNSLDHIKQFPVYLLHHQISDETKKLCYVCLGANPKASLFRLIEELISVCGGRNVGFYIAFIVMYEGYVGPLSRLGMLCDRRPV